MGQVAVALRFSQCPVRLVLWWGGGVAGLLVSVRGGEVVGHSKRRWKLSWGPEASSGPDPTRQAQVLGGVGVGVEVPLRPRGVAAVWVGEVSG